MSEVEEKNRCFDTRAVVIAMRRHKEGVASGWLKTTSQ
jgi:hypothetical protein